VVSVTQAVVSSTTANGSAPFKEAANFLAPPHVKRHSAATAKASVMSVVPTGVKVGNVRLGGSDGTTANFVQLGDAESYKGIKAVCTCGVPFTERVACSHTLAGCLAFKVRVGAVRSCCIVPFSLRPTTAALHATVLLGS
jgi:hypothetical protein